jgi:hypothetical protein
MKTTPCLLAAILLSVAVHAASATDTGGLQIKSKSQFNAAANMHNPFWPIGWVKQDRTALPTAVKTNVNISASGFTVTSILLGNPAIAVINGREYEEGQNLRVNGMRTDVQVVAIRDGEVILRSGASQIAVHMRQK